MTRSRHTFVALAALLATIGASLGASPAASQAAPIEVTVSGRDGNQSFLHRCFDDPEVELQPAELTVHRTGDLSAPLDVNVRYFGAAAALPSPVTIPAGSANATVLVEQAPPSGVGVEVLADGTYTVGSPASALVRIATVIGDPPCAFDLNVRRWVDVGSSPDPVNVAGRFDVDLAQLTHETIGAVPPGLAFERDGSWTGSATTPGRYEFGTRYCRQERCASGPSVTVWVFAAGDRPSGSASMPSPTSPPARPATPVPANAAYTG